MSDMYLIEDIRGIKNAALVGIKRIWVIDENGEGLILTSKYGKEWWQKATQEDIERIVVR